MSALSLEPTWLRLDVEPTEHPAARVVRACGVFDAVSAFGLNELVEHLERAGARGCLFDLAEVRFIAWDTDFPVLLRYAEQLEAHGGWCGLSQLHPKARTVFEMLGAWPPPHPFRWFDGEASLVEGREALLAAAVPWSAPSHQGGATERYVLPSLAAELGAPFAREVAADLARLAEPSLASRAGSLRAACFSSGGEPASLVRIDILSDVVLMTRSLGYADEPGNMSTSICVHEDKSDALASLRTALQSLGFWQQHSVLLARADLAHTWWLEANLDGRWHARTWQNEDEPESAAFVRDLVDRFR